MNVYSSSIARRLAAEAPFDWRWPVVASILVFQLLFVGWLVIKPGGEALLMWFDDISVAAAPLLAGVMSLVAARRYRGSKAGAAWAFIALGLFLFTFGDATWAIQELALGSEVPFPSVSDIGYLGAYPLVFVGLLLMPLAPATGRRRMKLTLDVLIGLAAIAVLSWNFIIAPFWRRVLAPLWPTPLAWLTPLPTWESCSPSWSWWREQGRARPSTVCCSWALPSQLRPSPIASTCIWRR